MKKVSILVLGFAIIATSCVSKKKFTQLQSEYDNTKVTLTKTTVEKEELEAKYGAIQQRVEQYNSKINSLKEANDVLVVSNDKKYDFTENGTPVSNDVKRKLNESLKNVNSYELAQAQTLEDSMNLAISHNLKRNLTTEIENQEATNDINIAIDETVVMINISDKLLFKSGSYRINKKANNLLERIAEVVNSEPAIEVMVEGHTDDRGIKNGASIKDNWELSVERSTAIVRELQNKHGVDPSKLIASGRSSYAPLVSNDNEENRATNRRTRIIILPNLDKFLALMASNE
jgi:chemotaxis protein MotB